VAYKVPTLEEMLAFLVALFKGLFPDRAIGSRFTPAWKLMKVIAGAITDVHANVATGLDNVMPDKARKEFLDRWIGIVQPGGIATRKGATPARRAKAGRVTGAVGATTVVGDQLIHRASGLLFQVNSNGTIPAAGYVDVDIVAIDTGSKTRLEAGEILEYLTTPPGISTQVELQLALTDDGYDQEQDGAARNRLLDAMSSPSSGGNQADYVGWALAQPGIAHAFCYPNRAGLGTVDIAALHAGNGTARKLNAGEIATLQAALAQLVPATVGGSGGGLRVLTTVEETANVELTITPDGTPAYAFDWDDSSAPTVLSWTAATRTLQFAGGARPGTLQAGHRLCIKGVASQQDSAPLVVESLSGPDSVVLQTVPKKPDGTDATPTSTDIVYAGGPMTAIIRDAIIAHINGDILYAGPSGPLPGQTAESSGVSTSDLQVLASGVGTSNPAGIYGTWAGALTRATLAKIAMYTRGVRNQAVIVPAADQDSTDYAFPNDSQIGFLVPGYVLVRRG
jgi:uncharacterized phage protein gp47/JayE